MPDGDNLTQREMIQALLGKIDRVCDDKQQRSEALAVLESKVDRIITDVRDMRGEIKDAIAAVSVDIGNNEERIRKLESRADKSEGRSNVQDIVLGLLTVIGSALGIAVKNP